MAGLLLTLNVSALYQHVKGFGGSLSDAAAINILRLSRPAQDNLLRSYFSESGERCQPRRAAGGVPGGGCAHPRGGDARNACSGAARCFSRPAGIEYNLVRLPMACSDFSVRPYSYDDVPHDYELKHFRLAEEDVEMKVGGRSHRRPSPLPPELPRLLGPPRPGAAESCAGCVGTAPGSWHLLRGTSRRVPADAGRAQSRDAAPRGAARRLPLPAGVLWVLPFLPPWTAGFRGAAAWLSRTPRPLLQIPLLHRASAMSKRPLLLYASPWTSPAWMKSNGDIRGKATLKGQAGDKYHKTWANYFIRYRPPRPGCLGAGEGGTGTADAAPPLPRARFLDEYAKRNVTFWGLTAQNEPISGFFAPAQFPTIAFSAEQQRDFIVRDLGPALARSPHRPRLLVLDDQRIHLPRWAEAVSSNARRPARLLPLPPLRVPPEPRSLSGESSQRPLPAGHGAGGKAGREPEPAPRVPGRGRDGRWHPRPGFPQRAETVPARQLLLQAESGLVWLARRNADELFWGN